MRRRIPSALLVATALFAATPDSDAQAAATVSLVEHAFGASPVYMVAGHGRLAVGVTRDSDIAVLAWPTPSCCDQLTHLASNALDARSRPRTGVREGFGVALGLVLETATGPRVTWLHDPAEWTATPGYTDDSSLEPRVSLVHASLGLTVTVLDTVLPDRDVLQRLVSVTRDATSPVTGVRLLSHTNLGLTQNIVPRLPVGDVLADSRNDFGALWDETLAAAVHFRPSDRAPVNELVPLVMPEMLPAGHFGVLDALMQNTGDVRAATQTLSAGLDTTFMPGVYAVVATDPPATQFQIGREGSAFCDELGRLVDNVLALSGLGIPLPIDPSVATRFRCPEHLLPASVAAAHGWTRVIASAWDDAQDGALTGNPVAAYLSDSAQRTDIAIDASGHGSARLFIGFGSTAAAARTVVRDARALTATAFVARDHDHWMSRASTVALPDTLPASIAAADRDRIVRAARRAVLHVYSGTDATTGAIVASIARQAPYGADWPRDGAFFDQALDVAGNTEAVSRRLAWALPLARTAPLTPGMINLLIDPAPPIDPRNGRRQYPEAAWEMNYYSNGTMAGFYRFEIDNTAWMVWTAAVHVGYVPAAERMPTALAYWEPIRRSTEMLAAWRDASNGLNAPANEDDNAAFTSSLHGGTAVFAALEASARVARFLGHTDEAARWEHRAGELRDALVTAFYDTTQSRFINVVPGSSMSNPGSAGLGPTAWLVWPARMLPYSDPRVGAQVRFDLQQVLAALRGDGGMEGGAYLTKTTLSAAIYLANGGDATLRPVLEECVARLARDVISTDTQVMGEVFVNIRAPDGTVMRRENRVSIPHLWEATLFYLTTMAMSHPERFDVDRMVLGENQTPAPGTVPFVPDAGSVPTDAGIQAMDANGADAGLRGGGACGCRTVAPVNGASVWLAFAASLALALQRRRRH